MLFRRRLGTDGPEVSALGMGCWAIGGPDVNLGMPMGWGPVAEGAAVAGLERAYQLGVSLFDTADIYGHGRSERLVGRLVEQVPRESLQLCSKVGYFSGTAPYGYHPGHMRRQLEQTLDNLRTTYLDVYLFHHNEFGPDDSHLEPAIEAMDQFRSEGLIRMVGMRGPHRFALDRLGGARQVNKVARFRELFEQIRPDVLAVRDNLLTPQDRSVGIFAFAAEHACGVLVNKPLAQGLLTGVYDPRKPRAFDAGDHRLRKRWFTLPALAVLAEGLDRVGAQFGRSTANLVRLALWSCLSRGDHVAVLVGFTSPEQVELNVSCLREPPDEHELAEVREIMTDIQHRLNAEGQVFVDEQDKLDD